MTVLDEEGKVIPTAVIRHPEEQFRHPVNTFDGSWADRVLYLPDGRELVFEKGLELELEISAPGYVNQHVIYVVKKKKNSLAVTLQKMEFSFDQDLIDEPVIQFGRDKPLDGAPIEDE